MTTTRRFVRKVGGNTSSGAAAPRAIGRIGRSQAVTTFGIGAIYELRTFANRKATLHSVMIAGLEAWDRYRFDLPVVREEVLERILNVQHFHLPPTEPEAAWDENPAVVPAVRFPQVLSCEKCGRVGRTGRDFADPGYGGVKCNNPGCGGRGIPFRLVVACHEKKDPRHPGHIDDFPYVWWAHRGSEACSAPVVHLESGKGTTGLAGLFLVCRNCKAPRQSLGGAFNPKALGGLLCHGTRPWLNDKEDGCTRSLQVLQRGASNTYFPVTASALSIPPYADRLFSLVNKSVNLITVASLRDGTLEIDRAVAMCRNMPGLDDPDVYSNDQIKEALLVISGKLQIRVPTSEVEQRQQERNAIAKGRADSADAHDFAAEPVKNLDRFPLLSRFLERLVMVHRLREVRALRGFHRVDSFFGGDSFNVEVAPLSKRQLNWLPAIEVRGEGVYIELSEDRLKKWERTPAVLDRVRILARNMDDVFRRNDWAMGPPITAREILIHTLSHLLMKQLSLECGYSGSSLRERLYTSPVGATPSYAGFLIYTGSTGADGTLGGLVSQGAPERLGPLLRSTLLSARWCSSDPLCGESKGQGVDALNLAACHACALVSEISCERRNTLLDRGFVTGTPLSPAAGFFAGVLEGLE